MAHLEEDIVFDRLGQVDTDLPTTTRDHYFWSTINSGQNKEVEFFLPDPFRGSSENLAISIGFHGLTYQSGGGTGGEHQVLASINQNSVANGSWTGQEEFTMISPSSLSIPHAYLLSSGLNKLGVFAPVSETPGVYDRIVFNWLEIGYEHLFKANEDALRFRKSYINPVTTLEYEVKNFTSPNLVIYKEALSKIIGYGIREIFDSKHSTFNLVFQDETTNDTPDYWVSTTEALLTPAYVSVDTLGNLRSLDGNFIVLTVPAFMNQLDDYLDFKRNEGWNPVVVSLADVYDEFNYGIKSPFAVKSFLKYANNHWPSNPEYVVFIGDAIADPKEAKRDIAIKNIPTFYMQTYQWGAAEADFWYSLINGDDYLPDLNIGRLPCNDAEDLKITLDKLIRYNTDLGYGSWQNEIITIAGFETIFKQQSQSLLKNEVPEPFMPSRVFIDRTSEGQIFWGDTDSLINLWNEGKLLINFLGHGGGAVWADRSLFVREDIDYLDAESAPAFVTSMTCFTSSFAQIQGLGEVVLTKSPAGAIGWFGSTGVGWTVNDFLMIQPLLRRLLEEHKTVGELMNTARIEYFLANSGYDYLKPSMLFQYTYLGDPTTKLALPVHEDLLSSSKFIYAQDEQLELNYIASESGTLKMLPINGDGQPWWQKEKVYENIPTHFLIDQEELIYNEDSSLILTPPSGESRTIYTLDRGRDKSAIQGYVPYGISSDWIEHRPPTAEELETSTDIPLRLKYHTLGATPDSIIVTFSGGSSFEESLVYDGEWWTTSNISELKSGIYNTYYVFSAFEDTNNTLNSQKYRLYLPAEITFSLNNIGEAAVGKRIGLEYEYSLQGLDEATITLNHQDSSADFRQEISEAIIIRKGNNSFFVPTYFGMGDVNIKSSMNLPQAEDGAQVLIDTIISPTYSQIIPGLGITFNAQNSDTLALWSGGYLRATSADTAWIRVQSDTNQITSTSGINFYRDSTRYQIGISNPDIDVWISSERPLFLKEPRINSWQILEKLNSEYSLQASGLVSMGNKVNTSGPRVSLMMSNQLFFDGDYILENSRLNLLAEDPDGFTWKKEDVSILVDGTQLIVQLGDTSQAAQEIAISASLELLPGEHQIAFRVSDALDNWSDEEVVSAVVAGEADIIDYGNYPNPFEAETLIIYELTQPLSDVVIDIYTLAGYKLHSIDAYNARVGVPLGAIGYHEVPWNGRDKNEEFVANGVYFYRIRGEADGKKLVGPVGKMVKNR
ncbi:MAG: hypothetical protein K9N35_01940 [Candidatus Marinimicrobia bacterium]|nr:hypothetical protein [Candidatus Neomarinimicrobiota bacterium]